MTKLNFSSKTINAGSNAKTVKGDDEYVTAIMYLAPYTLSGQNTCPMAKLAQCHVGCLNTAGRGQFNMVQNARIKKTNWFFNDRHDFMVQLDKDIQRFIKWCDRHKVKPAIRLNGTSDIRWENFSLARTGKTVFDTFTCVTFYDYTKISNRKTKDIKNYHLTWSYSEADVKYAAKYNDAILQGMNVAVVFRDKETTPKTFLGLKVIDGDKDDLRFLDPKGVVVGLYAKGTAKKDKTGFVIDTERKVNVPTSKQRSEGLDLQTSEPANNEPCAA